MQQISLLQLPHTLMTYSKSYLSNHLLGNILQACTRGWPGDTLPVAGDRGMSSFIIELRQIMVTELRPILLSELNDTRGGDSGQLALFNMTCPTTNIKRGTSAECWLVVDLDTLILLRHNPSVIVVSMVTFKSIGNLGAVTITGVWRILESWRHQWQSLFYWCSWYSLSVPPEKHSANVSIFFYVFNSLN
jgi:hypothetical protein